MTVLVMVAGVVALVGGNADPVSSDCLPDLGYVVAFCEDFDGSSLPAGWDGFANGGTISSTGGALTLSRTTEGTTFPYVRTPAGIVPKGKDFRLTLRIHDTLGNIPIAIGTSDVDIPNGVTGDVWFKGKTRYLNVGDFEAPPELMGIGEPFVDFGGQKSNATGVPYLDWNAEDAPGLIAGLGCRSAYGPFFGPSAPEVPIEVSAAVGLVEPSRVDPGTFELSYTFRPRFSGNAILNDPPEVGKHGAKRPFRFMTFDNSNPDTAAFPPLDNGQQQLQNGDNDASIVIRDEEGVKSQDQVFVGLYAASGSVSESAPLGNQAQWGTNSPCPKKQSRLWFGSPFVAPTAESWSSMTIDYVKIETPNGKGRLKPATMDFGSQAVGVGAPPQTTTLTNTGKDVLTLDSVGVSGPSGADFVVGADSCSDATLPPGGSCSVGITFTPSALGDRPADLWIPGNIPGGPSHVAMFGSGV